MSRPLRGGHPPVTPFEEKTEPRRATPGIPRERLVGVRQREQDALSWFFETYFDRIYSWAYRLIGERTAAEDVVQEVFLRVHHGAPTLDPDRDPWPWLLTITYNTCRDLWRSNRTRRSADTLSLDDYPADAGVEGNQSTPEREVSVRERERLVQSAILELQETPRAVVLLRDYHGLPHDEVAKIVGLSPAATRKCYSRALIALGKRLEVVLG